MAINETVLEMHYHRALVELIGEAFGLGPGGHYNFYKYSPQQECFIGFDQAFVKTEVSDGKLFKDLSDAASDDGYSLGKSYVGYFLQFKTVSKLVRFNKKTTIPPQISDKPFFRSDVYTVKSKASKYSQHELLFNLAKNHGAMTYYACPMVFDKVDLYKPADLSKLRLVDVATAPSAFQDNESHHIFFQTETGDPVWCSEPVVGRAVSTEVFARGVADELGRERDSSQAVLASLMWLREIARNADASSTFGDFGDFLAETLTIIEIERR